MQPATTADHFKKLIMKKLSSEEIKSVMGGFPSGWGGCVAKCVDQNATFSVCSCAAAEQVCGFYGGGVLSCSCLGLPNTCP